MSRTNIALAAVLLFSLLSRSSLAGAQSCTCPIESGINLSQFKIDQLKQELQDRNLPALRLFAWNMFYDLTRQSACGGDGIPKLLTWYRKEDVFVKKTCPSTFPPIGSPANIQSFLEQLPASQRRLLGLPANSGLTDVTKAFGFSALQGVLFNGPLADYLKTPFRLVNNCYDLTNPVDLCKLRKYAQAHDLTILQFPQVPLPDPDSLTQTSAAAKLTWLFAPKGKWTILPVWDPESNPPLRGQPNPPITFTRWVVVNPSVPNPLPDETPLEVQVPSKGEARSAAKVGVKRFFSIAVTKETRDQVQKLISKQDPDAKVQDGDLLLLVAMHVAAKVQDDWLWETFWWHDRPTEGYGSDRPPTITGVWKNYRMNISFDMDLPHEPDGSPRICFNPYVEAALGGNTVGDSGATSNCMSCHRLAALPTFASTNGIRFPYLRGPVLLQTPEFEKRITLDYLWSITGLAANSCDDTPPATGPATACPPPPQPKK